MITYQQISKMTGADTKEIRKVAKIVLGKNCHRATSIQIEKIVNMLLTEKERKGVNTYELN